MRRMRVGVHRTVLVVDMEEFGQGWRTTPRQVAVREGLDRALRRAFDDAGLPWVDCRVEDRGDGAGPRRGEGNVRDRLDLLP
ncbi:hypothetical protein [Actinocrispum wychmicini]|uniref:Uncharacterized protein n=1 Tax=Actinocrispum wychmicini TaxID=1213861 RepID=A0A4R2JZ97_9PSEU|nr:hypothetical protein [Actinocrispum wychmicini]TCO59455.1 hypothetical protein EV192_104297 [Actinocrispum wychmicini]